MVYTPDLSARLSSERGCLKHYYAEDADLELRFYHVQEHYRHRMYKGVLQHL